MVTILGAISIALGLGSVIVLVVPVLKMREVSMPSDKIVRSLVAALISDTPIAADIENAIFQFNKSIWNAFLRQRYYTTRGIFLLVLSVLFHILGEVTGI